jgi:ABC-type glycerol-3-phosphate transport system permease component
MELSRPWQIVRDALAVLVTGVFMFPIFWILLMSFQTNESILRMPPSIFFTPTVDNYIALVTGEMRTAGVCSSISCRICGTRSCSRPLQWRCLVLG